MGKPTIALGLPHCPWIPERVESFEALRAALGLLLSDRQGVVPGDSEPQFVRVFSDKESNRVWPQKLWRWAVSTGATHCLQLQDDAIVSPRFWPILRAMIESVPDQIIGLEANHPLGPEMFRTGRRWYRTRAWLVGVGYDWPCDPALPNGLPAFLRWCDDHPEIVEAMNEDSLVSHWAASHGFDIWHPVPTIIDHDLGVPSTYANDTHHEFSMYRRPTVTWRDVPTELSALEDPAYWRITNPPLLPGAGTQRCWFCDERQGIANSHKTGARICKECAVQTVCALLGIQLQFSSPPKTLPPDQSSPVRRPPCTECLAEGGHHLPTCSLRPAASEPLRPPTCAQCGGKNGDHDDGCAAPRVPAIPPDRPRINP